MAKSALGGNVLEAGSGGPASNTPTMTGSGRMTDVVADAAVWLDRARMADEAAHDLGILSDGLRTVVTRNSFGQGCIEGELLYARLREVIGEVAVEIQGSSRAAAHHAAACRAAADAYVSADKIEPR